MSSSSSWSGLAVLVGEPPVGEHLGDRLGDHVRLLGRGARVALVLDRQVAQAGAGQAAGLDRLAGALLDRAEPALVDDLRDEAAHVGVHAARQVEEQPALGRDRRLVAEQVLEHRGSGVPGVNALRDLGELERVAEQDEVAGGRADRERVRERDLAGLVDEQVVERLVHVLLGEEPGGAGDELHVLGRREVVVVVGALDEVAVELRLLVPPLDFFSPRNSKRSACATRSTSSSRLWIALWLFAVTPTRLPGSHQVDDQARAGPGLARAGRALDEEIAVVEAERDLPSPARARRTRPGAALPGSSPCDARQRALEDVAQRAVRAGAASTPSLSTCAASRRSAARCCLVSYGRPGISARGSGSSARVLPRLSLSRPATSSIERIVPAPLPVAGSIASPPARSLCSCTGNSSV